MTWTRTVATAVLLVIGGVAVAADPFEARDADRPAAARGLEGECAMARRERLAAENPEVAARAAEIRELKEQIREKALAYDGLTGPAKKQARAEIEGLAEQVFDLKVEQHRAAADAMEARAAALRAKIAEHEQDRERIIGERLDRILERAARVGDDGP